MSNPDNKEILKITLDALERLLKMFSIERYLYIALTVFSFLLLLYGIFQVFEQNTVTTKMLVSIFGGSGLIAVSSFRVVWFFNRSFSLIEGLIERISK